MTMKANVDAVIFTYLRPKHLSTQIQALKSQTHSIRNILIGHLNNSLSKLFKFEDLLWVTFNKDPGIRSTFITCTLVPVDCDYIFLLNDDILPGNKYVKNVLNSMAQRKGAYGAFGMDMLPNGLYRKHFPRQENNNTILEVSAIGQSYFFPYEYLHLFFEEQMPENWTSSDDLWFSYMLAKKKKKLLVAPHPVNDKEMWAAKRNLTKNDPPDKKLHKRNPLHKKHRKELIRYAQNKGVWNVI